jgi:hypothetical protein
MSGSAKPSSPAPEPFPALQGDEVATYLPLRADERAVIEAIRELPFGAVEVVVHQSRIVQIAKTQKLRVEPR